MSVEQTSQWTSLKHMGDLTVWNAMETCLPMVVTVCLLESLGILFASLLMFRLTGSPEQEHLNDRCKDVIVLTSTLFMGGFFFFLVEWRSHSKWSPDYGRCRRAHGILSGQQCGHYSGILEMRPEALGTEAGWEGVEAGGQVFPLDMSFFIQSPGRILFTELARSSHSPFTWIS